MEYDCFDSCPECMANGYPNYCYRHIPAWKQKQLEQRREEALSRKQQWSRTPSTAGDKGGYKRVAQAPWPSIEAQNPDWSPSSDESSKPVLTTPTVKSEMMAF